ILMAGVLEMFGLRKAAPVRSSTDDPGNPAVYRKGQTVVVTYHDVVNAVAALRHPVIARCVDVVAKAVQSVAWYAEADPDATASERAGTTRFIAELNALLRAPNDRMTG